MGRERDRSQEYLNVQSPDDAEIGDTKFRQKRRFDDDFRGLPRVKTNKDDKTSYLRFFRNVSGDRIITNMEKERPEVDQLIKALEIKDEDLVVNLGADDGVIGSTIATHFPKSRIILMDHNLDSIRVAERNTIANGLTNTEVMAAIGLQALQEQDIHPDVVVYTPNKFINYDLIQEQVREAYRQLRVGGVLYLLSHKKSGAQKHLAIVKESFGELNTGVVGKGSGGIRIIEALKNDSKETTEHSSAPRIELDILGNRIEVETGVSIFSKEGLDSGTRFLLETIDIQKANNILDIGCGWGAIGLVAATLNENATVTMVDIDLRAVALSNKNSAYLGLENRAKAIGTADILKEISESYDLVLSNPPFHQGTSILIELFTGVRDKTAKNGQIYLVVENSYVNKFTDILIKVMGNCKTIKDNGRYSILFTRR